MFVGWEGCKIPRGGGKINWYTISVQTDRAYNANPDQVPQKMVSNQILHCLPLIQQFLDTRRGT